MILSSEIQARLICVRTAMKPLTFSIYFRHSFCGQTTLSFIFRAPLSFPIGSDSLLVLFSLSHDVRKSLYFIYLFLNKASQKKCKRVFLQENLLKQPYVHVCLTQTLPALMWCISPLHVHICTFKHLAETSRGPSKTGFISNTPSCFSHFIYEKKLREIPLPKKKKKI